MLRHGGPWLVWLIEMSEARLNDGSPIVDNPHSGTVEALLLDAFACWPEESDAGVKPWTIAMRGGRVDGAPCPQRLRTVDGVTSRDERPRWPKQPFVTPPDPVWQYFPGSQDKLAPLPDFAAMNGREVKDWLSERLGQSPSLVSETAALFPLTNQGRVVQWVYFDEEFIIDRITSIDQGIRAPGGDWVTSFKRESRLGTRLSPSGRLIDFHAEFSRKLEPRRVTAEGLWREGPLPFVWEQRMAEAVNAAMFHWLPSAFHSGESNEALGIVTPKLLRLHMFRTGGVLGMTLRDTREPIPAPNAFEPYDPTGTVASLLGGRIEIDSSLAEVRDLETGQRLSFVETLDGSGDCEQSQHARFTYRDSDGEWPLIVQRPARNDPLRIDEWKIDLRGPALDEPPPPEARWWTIHDFIIGALLHWPDNERTGPAPRGLRVLGGYLNGQWEPLRGLTAWGGKLPVERPDDELWMVDQPIHRWLRVDGATPPEPLEPLAAAGEPLPAFDAAEWITRHPG
jgi:hypothetical protein